MCVVAVHVEMVPPVSQKAWISDVCVETGGRVGHAEKVMGSEGRHKLQVSTWFITKAVNAELGRCPIMHKASGLSVKYWLRLENGTEKSILN